MVNAEELLRHCQSTRIWSHLQLLALTSQFLQVSLEKRNQIEALLRRAGVFIQQLPKLHTFVLWNGGKAQAYAFVCCIDRDSVSATWRGTWHLELSPLMVKSWQLAVLKLPCKQECIPGAISSHRDAIYHLKLSCQVIDPASLWQFLEGGIQLNAVIHVK